MNTNPNPQGGADDASQDHATRSQRRATRAADDTERERTRAIADTGAAYSRWVTPQMIATALREGTSADAFNDQIMERMQNSHTDATTVAAGPSFIRQRGDPTDILGRYSMARAILSQVDPAGYMRQSGFEAEQSRELQRSSPMEAAGMLIPMAAFFPVDAQQRDFNMGTASQAGNLIQTSVFPELTDVLRQRSVVVAMGAKVLPGLRGPLNLPRKTVSSQVGWVTEVAAFTETAPVTAVLALTPKRIGAYVEPSRQAIISSDYDVLNLLAQDLRDAILSEVDRVVLNGSGTGGQPVGIGSVGGMGIVIGGTNGATLNWQHILDLESSVDLVNGIGDLRTTGYVINPQTRAFMKRTPRHATLAEGLIMGDAPNDKEGFNILNGYRAGVTAKMPSNLTKGTNNDCSRIYFGDFSQVVIAQFGGGVEIIVDQYTLATTGQVRITANLFADCGLRQPGAFTSMDDARLL